MIRLSRRNVGIALVTVSAAIQLVPVRHDNPSTGSSATLAMPDTVRTVFRRSCNDCHSHDTTWPWYAYVAPASWLVSHDVTDGRRHLNLSNWDAYAPDVQQRKLLDLTDEIQMGDMPPWYYTRLHPDAALTQTDLDAVVGWAEAASAKLAGKTP